MNNNKNNRRDGDVARIGAAATNGRPDDELRVKTSFADNR